MQARSILRGVLVLLCVLSTTEVLSAPQAQAISRAYLSSAGKDSSPCTERAPCRLLPAALDAVADGGEIWMLDSANYNTGPVIITKSVTILAIPGAVGSVVAAGGNAIDIATAGVRVTLRNLVIVPLPGAGGTNGVSMSNGSALAVDQCSFSSLAGVGIHITAPARVGVVKSVFRGVFGSGLFVQAATASSITLVDVADSTFDGAGVSSGGIVLVSQAAASGLPGGAITAMVRDSRIFQQVGDGLLAQSNGGGSVTLAASNNHLSNSSGPGISAIGSGAKVWASGNAVSGNDLGFVNLGGVFESAGNNAVRANTINDIAGTITVPASPLK